MSPELCVPSKDLNRETAQIRSLMQADAVQTQLWSTPLSRFCTAT